MSWPLASDSFVPAEEGLREALCALGNGYFVTRGCAAESRADGIHYPGTYLAGGYNRLETRLAGRTVENEDLVNLPNWLALSFRIDDGAWLCLNDVEILAYRQELDVERGLLSRDVCFRDAQTHTVRLREQRLVSMRHPHIGALQIELTAEDWRGTVEVRTALDGEVTNSGVARYRGLNGSHLLPLEARVSADEQMFLKVQTTQSELRVAQAARTKVRQNGELLISPRRFEQRPGYIAQYLTASLEQGDRITVEKIAAMYTSRDRGISECGVQARQAASSAGSFDELLACHQVAWNQLWLRFDTSLEFASRERDAQIAWILRLYVFHLLQTVSMHTEDLDAGVPARGWHGEAYRGHIFWDELFIFPLLNLRIPEITRSLLKYRCRRLSAARGAARAAGFRGAMFPWQSGSDGREESQQLHLNPRSGRWIADHSHLQRHVNAAIAYNLWQYLQATEDTEFLAYHGAEVILEIARFWASATTFNAELDRYEIKGVMGPDEYHEAYPGADEPGLNNNSYTNLMAVWVLDCASQVLQRLSEHRRRELCELLDLRSAELQRWRDIGAKMRLVFHADGILSQFEGYEDLREFDWAAYREEYGDIRRVDRILEAEGDTPNAYKLSKQADVLMLFYLFSAEELERLITGLGYRFDPHSIPRTIDYYAERTTHGSTLSRIVSSWVLARRDWQRSWTLFEQALKADLRDGGSGTTYEGIHLGAMAGVVDLVQRAYTGIELRDDALHMNPCLPDQLCRMKLRIRYRSHPLMLEISRARLKVSSENVHAQAITLHLPDGIHELRGGDSREFVLG
ncbi:MAG: glycoside hydrolase family 65 protein [Gammaproteobacteria bacterium]|nr:glycoside hydrolase family 65 protein [Gammaproteobacteria bacterium]